MNNEQLFYAAQQAFNQAAAAETRKEGFEWNRDYIKVEQAGRNAAYKRAIELGCDQFTAYTVAELVQDTKLSANED